MNDKSIKWISIAIKSMFYIILLVIFYLLYGKKAWDQYKRESTTFSVSLKVIEKLEPPIIIICPDPPFKSAFFKQRNISDIDQKMFWHFEQNWKNLNENKTIFEIYKDMSLNYYDDWNFATRTLER